MTPLSVQTKGKALRTTKAEAQKEQHVDGEAGNSMAIDDALTIAGHVKDPRYLNEKPGSSGNTRL